jgi:hypothetical protein
MHADKRTAGCDEVNRRFSRLFAKAPKMDDKYNKEPLIKSLSDHAKEKNTRNRGFLQMKQRVFQLFKHTIRY